MTDHHKRAEPASEIEQHYIQVFGRPRVVAAYRRWRSLSDVERTMIAAAVHRGDKVLDLGCGAGRLAAPVREHGGKYQGLDACAAMVEAAREENEYGQFAVQNMVEAEFATGSFDCILLMHNSIDAVHPYERRLLLLDKIAKWLVPGGRLVMSSHLLREDAIAPRSETVGSESPYCYVTEEYHGATLTLYRAPLYHVLQELREARLTPKKVEVEFLETGLEEWGYILAYLPSLSEDFHSQPMGPA